MYKNFVAVALNFFKREGRIFHKKCVWEQDIRELLINAKSKQQSVDTHKHSSNKLKNLDIILPKVMAIMFLDYTEVFVTDFMDTRTTITLEAYYKMANNKWRSILNK